MPVSCGSFHMTRWSKCAASIYRGVRKRSDKWHSVRHQCPGDGQSSLSPTRARSLQFERAKHPCHAERQPVLKSLRSPPPHWRPTGLRPRRLCAIQQPLQSPPLTSQSFLQRCRAHHRRCREVSDSRSRRSPGPCDGSDRRGPTSWKSRTTTCRSRGSCHICALTRRHA